jgi:hypothetical protein
MPIIEVIATGETSEVTVSVTHWESSKRVRFVLRFSTGKVLSLTPIEMLALERAFRELINIPCYKDRAMDRDRSLYKSTKGDKSNG